MLKVMEMMDGGKLRAALGETVAGVPVDTVLEATRNDIAGNYPSALL